MVKSPEISPSEDDNDEHPQPEESHAKDLEPEIENEQKIENLSVEQLAQKIEELEKTHTDLTREIKRLKAEREEIYGKHYKSITATRRVGGRVKDVVLSDEKKQRAKELDAVIHEKQELSGVMIKLFLRCNSAYEQKTGKPFREPKPSKPTIFR